MRLYIRNNISFKVLHIKKIIAILVICAMFGIVASGFFTRMYKPFIVSSAIAKTNNVIQKMSNDVVLNLVESGEYGSFVTIIKNEDGDISGVETNTIIVNKFKSEFVSEISKRLQEVRSEKFGISLLSFLNNPFLSEIGPYVYIKLKPIGIISADIENTFVSVGVNQSKHQIDINYKIKVLIVMPGIQTEHFVASSIPVAQTVIVGEVPQSYTNVTTNDDNMADTVLQLAEN